MTGKNTLKRFGWEISYEGLPLKLWWPSVDVSEDKDYNLKYVWVWFGPFCAFRSKPIDW